MSDMQDITQIEGEFDGYRYKTNILFCESSLVPGLRSFGVR